MNIKKQIVRSVLLVFLTLLIFGHLAHQTALAQENDFIVEEDITYCKVGDVELKLNLARPAKGMGPFPAFVFIQWSGMGRRTWRMEIREAAKRGYVAVVIDYRHWAWGSFPAQVHDVKCVVRWLRANARKYKIDPNRIGALGWSAGGYLALMLGLTQPSDGLEGECGNLKYSSRVQAVVNLAGISDLISYYKSNKTNFLVDSVKGSPEEAPNLHKKASPLTYVRENSPPVLSFHGNEDNKVSIEQPELLDAKMKEMGAPHTLIILKGTGHAVLVDDNVWNFFDEHLKED
jgi:dipeptidyl aminopeptidase/acylaminoacyl peptidase